MLNGHSDEIQTFVSLASFLFVMRSKLVQQYDQENHLLLLVYQYLMPLCSKLCATFVQILLRLSTSSSFLIYLALVETLLWNPLLLDLPLNALVFEFSENCLVAAVVVVVSSSDPRVLVYVCVVVPAAVVVFLVAFVVVDPPTTNQMTSYLGHLTPDQQKHPASASHSNAPTDSRFNFPQLYPNKNKINHSPSSFQYILHHPRLLHKNSYNLISS
mmetsp:Transcript_10394/g.18734  ORF Transcript_10394/g.18734 Transcript_10394/m.18734 type:complete len:215 (-) Transcript_10394:9-653(-)